jgi:hypothetical protein
MEQEPRIIRILPPVAKLLERERDALESRRIEHIRLVPLILREKLEVLVQRRRRIFTAAQAAKTDYGFEVAFTRELKRRSIEERGRIVSGSFKIIDIADDIAVVVVTSVPDISRHGPKRFCEKAYPIARRPFFTSTTLTKILDDFATRRKLRAVSLYARGYHRETGRSRQDCFRQPPAQAVMEMASQNRSTHSLLVSFRRSAKEEVARFAFDRTASANVRVGNPLVALQELVLPGVLESMAASSTYQIERAEEAVEQEMVELEFRDSPFDNFDTMYALCDAVRKGEGLNVSIIHLNPYLQAQVSDFFTGTIVDMLVIDQTNISLIPRSPNAGPAMERVANTILEHFGEAKAKRLKVLADA